MASPKTSVIRIHKPWQNKETPKNSRVSESGLIDSINEGLELLKIKKPYHESDHVLNIAYNILCEGRVLARWKIKHIKEKEQLLKMDFRSFFNSFINIPCRIVKTGRRIWYHMLNWNPWQHVMYRLQDDLHT